MLNRLAAPILAAMLLSSSNPAAAAPTVRSGIEAWQQADYSKAVSIWRPLAEKGDADAQFNLGQAYKLGRGVATDLAKAQVWFERAAKRGHLDAQTNLGLLLFQNGDRTGAMRWLKIAAESGEPRAMLLYGTALYNGDGVARDPARAYAFIARSAEMGFGPAKESLAEMNQVMLLADKNRGAMIARDMAAGASTAKRALPRNAKAPSMKAAAVASTPAKSTAAAGMWRVQLGAFAQRSAAETLFRKLAATPPLAGKSASMVPSGGVTRLQAGPFASRDLASSACATLKARGQACFVVPPR